MNTFAHTLWCDLFLLFFKFPGYYYYNFIAKFQMSPLKCLLLFLNIKWFVKTRYSTVRGLH